MTDHTDRAREWLCDPTPFDGDDDADIKSLAALLQSIEAETIERCAAWHVEQAEMCRHIAKTTREEWCGSDLSEEDRRANFKYAREHDVLAGIHDRHARGIRALLPPAAAEKTTPQPSEGER